MIALTLCGIVAMALRQRCSYRNCEAEDPFDRAKLCRTASCAQQTLSAALVIPVCVCAVWNLDAVS